MFEQQGGVLRDEGQLLRDCREVLGNPVTYTGAPVDAAATNRIQSRGDAVEDSGND